MAREVTLTPTISTGLYAAGDAIGGLLTLSNVVDVANESGTIVKVVIIDNDDEQAPIDVVFFSQPFAATADNAAFDPTDADLANCIGYILILATDYSSFNDNAVATKASGDTMPFDFDLPSGTRTLYAQMVIRAGHTFTATNDLTIKITVS